MTKQQLSGLLGAGGIMTILLILFLSLGGVGDGIASSSGEGFFASVMADGQGEDGGEAEGGDEEEGGDGFLGGLFGEGDDGDEMDDEDKMDEDDEMDDEDEEDEDDD